MTRRKWLTWLLVLCTALCLTAAALAADPLGPDLTVEVGTWDDLQMALKRGGDIMLTADVTADQDSSVLTVPNGAQVTLDLNEYTISRNRTEACADGGVFLIQGTMTLTGDGTVTGGYSSGNGGAVYVDGGSLILDGATLSGNSSNHGGGVYVGAGGSLTLNSGAVTGNSAKGKGGGVYVKKGIFTMNGGSITNNSANNGSAAVHVLERCTFNLNGGAITGNISRHPGQYGVYPVLTSVFRVSGSPVVAGNYGGSDDARQECNVFVQSGYLIGFGSAPLSSEARIGVTLRYPPTADYACAFTDGLASNNGSAAGFFSDSIGSSAKTVTTYSMSCQADPSRCWAGRSVAKSRFTPLRTSRAASQ